MPVLRDGKRRGVIGALFVGVVVLCATGMSYAQSDRNVSTVREKPAPMAVPFAGNANLSEQPRYYLDTIDTLNRITGDATRGAPGLAKNNYVGKVYEIRNTQAIEIQTYLLRILAYEGGIAEVMGADSVKDEKGKTIQYLFVVAPDSMIPGVDEIVEKCDRPGFKFFDATGGDFGGGPGAVKYVGKHRTASELVAILNGTEIGNVGGFLFPPFADDSTNQIYIIENPTDIADDIAALEMFDKPPLQVELACTIYEFDMNDGGTLGVDWDSWKRHLTGFLAFTSQSDVEFFDEDFNFYDVLLRLDAQALVEFLNYTVQSSYGKVVTATKITMVNSEDQPGALSGGNRGAATGQPAVIESTVNIPFTVLQTDVGPTNSTNAQNEVVDQAFEGVRVEILPFIGTESITLQIDAQVNSIVGFTKGKDIPIISTRRSNSVVNIKDGEPIVLSGLEKTTYNSSKTGLPFLLNIPVVKYLFAKETAANTKKSQVVIALTPRMKNAGAPEPDLAAVAGQ